MEAYANQAIEPARALDNLASAVNRVNSAQVNISRFIDRFHGPSAPQETAGASQVDRPEPTHPHNVNIERLFSAIDRLESRVEALSKIG